MRIQRNHSVGKSEAIRRIETRLEEFLHSPLPAGITLIHHARTWSDCCMRFEFKLRKSIVLVQIDGTVTVSDDSVILDCEVPAVVKFFLPEKQIEQSINGAFDKLFSQSLASASGQ